MPPVNTREGTEVYISSTSPRHHLQIYRQNTVEIVNRFSPEESSLPMTDMKETLILACLSSETRRGDSQEERGQETEENSDQEPPQPSRKEKVNKKREVHSEES